MSKPLVDLRSDTLTLPTPEMRRAMFEAEVGDDMIDVDPSVERLQRAIAERLGKEAALFVPSGTMANQVALRIHCRAGDEFLCEEDCHIVHYEQGAFASLSGLVARTVRGRDSLLSQDLLGGRVRPESEHMSRTRLLCLENTHNRGGGSVLPLELSQSLCEWARGESLATHLDGARLFNAAVATGIDASQWCRDFDTVSVCFSKGLGAPVGSALVGSRDAIREARRHRKAMGGAMRQCGFLAAAAHYALDHYVERLAEDHAVAQVLAAGIRRLSPVLRLQPDRVETNIVIFEIDPAWGTPQKLLAGLAEAGVRAMPFGPTTVRFVTHWHVSLESANRVCRELERAVASR